MCLLIVFFDTITIVQSYKRNLSCRPSLNDRGVETKYGVQTVKTVLP